MNPVTKFALALHTTTPQLGLGLLDLSTAALSSQVWDLGRSLSSDLHCYLGDFIQPRPWQALGFVAVAKGPGGFTGTRIGVVTARTLAQQLDVPLFGVSTLAAIAWQMGKEQVGTKWAVSLPARRGELFGAIYEITATGVKEIIGDDLFLPDSWQNLVGEQGAIMGRSPEQLGATVDAVLELAYLQWQQNPVSPWGTVVPFYGQHPVHPNQAR
jgi:tRNA threonylcarbamoyl adenosine modification protein YeaZ